MNEPNGKPIPFLPRIFKIFVFLLPSTIATELMHQHNHLTIALSWICGAFLQALIPPARQGFLAILGFAIIAGTAYMILWK
jgi:hypothetical protein